MHVESALISCPLYNIEVNKILEAKLKTLPNSPGVYFHKSKSGEVIYVGKAAILKNRVRQYFQSGKNFDNKTQALVNEIDTTDWIETDSEVDALFLESEMVKRYMPRYNILLRDDKSQLFIRIDMKSEWPYVGFTRNPADDGANYYGPYYNGFVIKKALRYLRKVFPYYTAPRKKNDKPDLNTYLGLNPSESITSREYKVSLKNMIKYIKGDRKDLVSRLEKDMKLAAGLQDFEKAAEIRNQLRNLRELRKKIMFGDSEFMNISKDQALSDLTKLLGLKKIPNRIEGYDISHMSGTNVVASMVVFTNGVSDRAEYRKFKVSEKNNDFENMAQVISRRFSDKNIKAWGLPNLVLIDGGKGQLGSALKSLSSHKLDDKIAIIGLAKKEEKIVVAYSSGLKVDKLQLVELSGYTSVSDDFIIIDLPNSTHVIKLLQRIRDESHRFAVSYHSVLKLAKQKSNELENIPGIGPLTRRKLIKSFGSLREVKTASIEQLTDIVGKSKAKIIKSNL